MTTAEICSKYNVTQEQIDRCDRIIDFSKNRVFYLVESQSEPGTYYRVEYNRLFHCLQCKPHNGRACPASLKGLPCWHKRASLCSEEIYKAEIRERRKAELEAYLAEIDARKAQSATV